MPRKRMQVIDRGGAGKLARYQAFDILSFEVAKDASQRQMTREGFMVAPANISRTGIQEYTALELGLEGTNRTIRLYRPPEEVFKPESYETFERQTLTSDHPDGDVTAATYRSVTSGDVHDVAPAGDDVNLAANLYVKDASTIDLVVQWGKNQLSCGYSFALDMTSGTSPEGEAYDGVMRDIVGNHVAIVWNARGGPGLRVADSDPTPARTNIMRIRIKDAKGSVISTFDVDDKIGDSVQDALDRHDKALMDCMAAHDTVKTERDVLSAKVDEMKAKSDQAATDAKKSAGDAAVEIEKLRAQIVTPEQQLARDEARAKLIGDAKTILGDGFDSKGKTEAQIRVAALDHVMATEGPAKNVAKAVLGGTEPAKASDKDATTALDAVIGLGGTAAVHGNDAARRAFAPAARDGGGSGTARTVKYGSKRLGASSSQ